MHGVHLVHEVKLEAISAEVDPVGGCRLCIVNDELFVRNATPYETEHAFSTPLPVPSSGSVIALSQGQQQMVKAFSSQSGMKLEWSQK
ncbi:Nuclear RNA export factor 1 [Galemys pyrenaicus]|uniref:Nuclear RNA export factor 1 n=1 Tax=Galemys pyrenaicus TaxID=202257 RepID=A0A8J5ZNK8_GALPY|nr:Nuclear RNA export factor 1 [Galemys pyrenaicus]